MEFIEGTKGIYKPIRVLYNTPIYEHALRICWHMPSYKTKIAIVVAFLKLQQKNKLPSTVTAEDMVDLLVKESKVSLRFQIWEFEHEAYGEDVQPLLQLVWEINNSMQKRDVEFEAKRLLDSPKDIPLSFNNPKIISQAQTYARVLEEQQQQAHSSTLLGPIEVVMDVVPKVLQGIWVPLLRNFFSMPSQGLSVMAVSICEAILQQVSAVKLPQVSFSRSKRDDMVLAILGKVREIFPPDILRKKLRCFEPELLSTITHLTIRSIFELFESQTQLPLQDSKTPEDKKSGSREEDGPAVMSDPPAPVTPEDHLLSREADRVQINPLPKMK